MSDFEPQIIAFLCNWCTYVAADAAGVSRFIQKPNVRVIRVNCSGMVDPQYVIKAFASGAEKWIAASEPGPYQKTINEMTEEIRKLGPYKRSAA